MIKNVFNIEGPKERVYQVLVDFPAYASWTPGCKSSTVSASMGNRTDVDITMSGMKTFHISLRFSATPNDLLSFEMINCKDLKSYSGTYRLLDAAHGTGTVVITELEMDAGALVPRFLLDRVVKKTLEDTGRALQQEIRKRIAGAAAAAVAATGKGEARRRARRLLQISKVGSGYRIWYLGRVYDRKDVP